jgi:hypothetical protein
MRKLKLSEWASISEIIASVVIVVSLVYVGFELNQNTQALQQGSYQSVLDRLAQSQMALALDEDLLNIVAIAEISPTELSAIAWRRFSHYVLPHFGEWEYLYLSKKDNAISDPQWLAFEPYFLGIFCKPGYRRFWNENRHAYSEEFIGYIETEVSPGCDGR